MTIDRPKGSHHPVYKDLCYPINYGYIDGVMAPDGEEQDAYIIGIDEPVKKFTGKVVAIIHRKDDIEDKWVVCLKILHIQSQKSAVWYISKNSILIMR